MIENRYPIFEAGRVLKKETLHAIRDYTFDYARIQYCNYSDGILSGCEVSVNSENLEVGPGLVKHRNRIFLISDTQKVCFLPTGKTSVLKLRFFPEEESFDFRTNRAEFTVDENVNIEDDEIELCCFKLSSGFSLRSSYTCFEDMQTEFDTINLINSSWAAPEVQSLSPKITSCFANEAMKYDLTNPWDISFCMRCLELETAVPKSVIRIYIEKRLKEPVEQDTNISIFNQLNQILKMIKNKEELSYDHQERHRHKIFVG